MKKILPSIFRWIFYLLGLIILALGIILNSKCNLGVSPIVSVSFTVSEILNWSFGNTTLIWYCIFVFAEILIHIFRKEYKKIIMDILQIPVSIFLTRFINLFSVYIPDFSPEIVGEFWGGFIGKLIILLIAIIATGIGAAMSLNVRLIPNPGDGIVQAVADCLKKSVSFTKNLWDLFCVCLTFVVSLVVLHKLLGIGIGTILAMLLVGRVMWLFNKICQVPMEKACGIGIVH